MAESEPLDLTAEEDETDFDALLKELKSNFRDDSEKMSDWREEAMEDYAFRDNEQWADEDRKNLQDKNRPVLTYNRIGPLIRAVQGEQINNAQEVRFLPREPGDARANELLTAAAGWFREQCNADHEESEAFLDAVTGGVGCTETRLESEDDPNEPASVIERVDPFEMLWDCHASKANLIDTRRVWRVKSNIPIEEALEKYHTLPNGDETTESDLDATWARLSEFGSAVSDSDEAREYESDGSDWAEGKKKDTVTIVQCQWWEKRTFYKALDPFTNELKTMDEATYTSLTAKLKKFGMPLKGVKLRRKVFRQAFIGRTILKIGDSPCPTAFTFNFITGFRDRNNGQWYGLVRAMKDPQRMANKFFSQTMHLFNTNSKGGYLLERGSVDDVEEFERSIAKSDELTWVEDGALAGGRIQQKQIAPFPASSYQMMEYSISSIRDVSGINLEMLGMREGNQPASLELQRRQSGMTILASLFRSMRSYHFNQGRVMLYFIQNHLSDGRLIKIVGEEGAQYVPLLKQADAKYDIVVDEGPTSPNQKERVWGMMGQNFFQLPPPIQLALLKYSPLPESVVEEVKKASQQMSEGPQAKMQEQMAQIEAQVRQIEGQLKQAQTQKTQAETQKIAAEIGMPDAPPGGNPMLEHQTKMADIQTKAQTAREGFQVELQKGREKNASDLQRDRDWQAQDSEVRRQDREADMMVEVAKVMLAPKPEPMPKGKPAGAPRR
jgi:hypothetical protein